MHILLDIGHADGTGAQGNGLEEHAVATTIVAQLKPMMEGQGYKVTVLDYPNLTNTQDLNRTVKEANIIYHAEADRSQIIGISIHCDCSDNAEAHGGHVCYHPASTKGKAIAQAIAQPLAQLLPGRAETTVAHKWLYVLNGTSAPWVLCECGFISNAHDAQIQRDDPGSIAQAIAKGINDYIKTI
jgi:N-acetylmuramoyl-L-alanine amidase